MQAAADAGEREPALGVGRDGLRPGAEARGRDGPDVAAAGPGTVEAPAAEQGRLAEDAVSWTSTPAAGWPFTSTSLPRMTCSGWRRISAAGCSASGLSCTSRRPEPGAAARPGRRPRRSGPTRCGAPRGGSGRRRRPALAEHDVGRSLHVGTRDRRARRPDDVHRRTGRRLAVRVRARGRSTVIRAGRRGFGLRLWPGPIGLPRLDPCLRGGRFLHGLLLHRQRAGEEAGAGGEGGEEQQGHRGELELVDQHGLQDLLGQGRGGCRDAAGGGVTGRERDRGPGRGIAQEG